uniref:C2 domain-containing protein n=1 Tax=Alexandrium monilatum TaxID=311494 RepID=A0A7S4Q5V0_9DINO
MAALQSRSSTQMAGRRCARNCRAGGRQLDVVCQRMVGEWCCPQPMFFKPTGAPATLLSEAGNIELVVAMLVRDGRRMRVVTLTNLESDFAVQGHLDISCTKLNWSNGATWTKAVQAKAERPEEVTPAEPKTLLEPTERQIAREDSDTVPGKVVPGCCLCLGGPGKRSDTPLLAASPAGAQVAPPLASPPLSVEVIRARGLSGAEGASYDISCKCQIRDKPGSGAFTTQVVPSSSPIWNHLGELDGYSVGDSLELVLLALVCPGSIPIGKVILPSDQFHPGGFEGEVRIQDTAEGRELGRSPEAPRRT